MIDLPVTKEPEGYVYCILFGCDGEPIVKVGSTKNPDSRFRGLKSQVRTGISEVNIWKVDDCRAVELQCHHLLCSLRVKGEWYKSKYYSKILNKLCGYIRRAPDWFYNNIEPDGELFDYRNDEARWKILSDRMINAFELAYDMGKLEDVIDGLKVRAIVKGATT